MENYYNRYQEDFNQDSTSSQQFYSQNPSIHHNQLAQNQQQNSNNMGQQNFQQQQQFQNNNNFQQQQQYIADPQQNNNNQFQQQNPPYINQNQQQQFQQQQDIENQLNDQQQQQFNNNNNFAQNNFSGQQQQFSQQQNPQQQPQISQQFRDMNMSSSYYQNQENQEPQNNNNQLNQPQNDNNEQRRRRSNRREMDMQSAQYFQQNLQFYREAFYDDEETINYNVNRGQQNQNLCPPNNGYHQQYQQYNDPEAAARRFLEIQRIFSSPNFIVSPKFCVPYIAQIYKIIDEQEKTEEKQFMEKFQQQPVLTSESRMVLFEWISGVIDTFDLSDMVLHLTIKLHDNYFSKFTLTNINKYQQIGLALMLIASKYVEKSYPEVERFVYIGGGCCSKREIVNSECKILNTLDFKLDYITAEHYLRMYLKMAGFQQNQIKLIRYCVEVTYLDYSKADLNPHMIVCGSIYLQNFLLHRFGSIERHSRVYQGPNDLNQQEQIEGFWPKVLQLMSGYSEKYVRKVSKHICITVRSYTKLQPNYQFHTIRSKYADIQPQIYKLFQINEQP